MARTHCADHVARANIAASMSRLKLAIVALVVVLAVAASLVLPVGQWMLDAVTGIRGLGAWGMVVFALLYVVATVAMLPGSVLTIAAGFAYGLLGGVAVVVPAAVVGATASFVLGRSVAGDWVRARTADRPRMAAVNQAIAERGFSIIFLLRLSPLFPFNLLNYSLGLTRARLRDYVIATATGILPGSLLYVYIGTTITDLAALDSGRPDTGSAGRIMLWLGLAATLGVTVWISRLARARLEDALRATPEATAKATPSPGERVDP